MQLNLLTLLVAGNVLVERWSTGTFVKSNGVWTVPVTGETLLDSGEVVVSGDFTLPGDIKPRWYKLVGGTTFEESPEYGGPPISGPGIPLVNVASVSRPRFDAIFAGVCGEANYQNVLTAIRTIAEIEPATDDTAKMRRAWEAFNNAPAEGIGYPISDWTDLTAPNPLDLTGSFFALISVALVGPFPLIKTWLIDGCVAWSELST